MKTNELVGDALNRAVHTALQYEAIHKDCTAPPYSTDWAFGGPIIEREGIVVDIRKEHGWVAAREFWYLQDAADHDLCSTGPTYLIAAMRCFVASQLGDEVEIPEQLLGEGK